MYFTNKAIAPIKAKRHSDALAIRHNDGIKDLFIKIKQQCRDLINYFKQLPKSKKVVLVLSQILKLASIAYGIYTNKVSAPRVSEKVSGLKKEAEVLNGQIGWRNIENEKLQKTISELKARLDSLKDLQSRLPGYGMKNLIDPVQKQYNKSQKLYEHYNRQINEKNERIGKINTEVKSTETSLKLKLFISLLGFFISIVGDTAALRKDAGVKGMKKGQHIKAKNEEYVQSLRGGGGNRQTRPQQLNKKRTQKGVSAWKRAAVGAGALALGLGAGYLAGKGLRRMTNNFSNKVSAKLIKPTAHISKNPGNVVSSTRKAISSVSSAAKNAAKKTINYANASDFKKALNDPNHVWDI